MPRCDRGVPAEARADRGARAGRTCMLPLPGIRGDASARSRAVGFRAMAAPECCPRIAPLRPRARRRAACARRSRRSQKLIRRRAPRLLLVSQHGRAALARARARWPGLGHPVGIAIQGSRRGSTPRSHAVRARSRSTACTRSRLSRPSPSGLFGPSSRPMNSRTLPIYSPSDACAGPGSTIPRWSRRGRASMQATPFYESGENGFTWTRRLTAPHASLARRI
jgi:hypothetical protein